MELSFLILSAFLLGCIVGPIVVLLYRITRAKVIAWAKEADEFLSGPEVD